MLIDLCAFIAGTIALANAPAKIFKVVRKIYINESALKENSVLGIVWHRVSLHVQIVFSAIR
jgi:hypothetical protein